MAAGAYGTVAHFDRHAAVRFERQVTASPRHVWAALTDQDAVSTWSVPGTVERHVDGGVSLDFGQDQQVTGRVLQYEPPQTLE